MNKTGIEYLTHSWNPIKMCCTPVSQGCANCWHLAMDKRFMQHKGAPVLNEKELLAPLRLKKPARIGVQFMGDLFHKDVSFEFINKVWEVMEKSPRHTFFILTKRPEQMREFMRHTAWGVKIPLPNVWLGVSVEDQKTADERMPLLLRIATAHRWVSYEPAIGAVAFKFNERYCSRTEIAHDCDTVGDLIHWVVMGGESGPKARPMQIKWARKVRDDCKDAGVPFMLKQMMVNGKLEKLPLLDGVQHKEGV